MKETDRERERELERPEINSWSVVIASITFFAGCLSIKIICSLFALRCAFLNHGLFTVTTQNETRGYFKEKMTQRFTAHSIAGLKVLFCAAHKRPLTFPEYVPV
jgi:putative exporter of polyketide antibiotics